jgi:hypothetical protein
MKLKLILKFYKVDLGMYPLQISTLEFMIDVNSCN